MKRVISILFFLFFVFSAVPVFAVSKVMTVDFPQQTNSNAVSKTVTIPNLKNVVSVTAATPTNASVNHSVSGNDVTVTIGGGSATSSGTQTQYVTTSQTSSSSSFPSTYYYNSGGYSGTLTASGSPYVISGSYTPSSSKTQTASLTNSSSSFSSTYYYSSGGYSGTLYANGSPYVISGSYTPGGSKTASTSYYDTSVTWYQWVGSAGNYYWLPMYCNDPGVKSQWYNDGTYSGWLSTYVSDYQYQASTPALPATGTFGQYFSQTNYFKRTVSGTVTSSSSDTRIWQQNYVGTVSSPASDTRIWKQDYAGTVSSSISIWQYQAKITYNDNDAPTINVISPTNALTFSTVVNKNIILDGTVKDSNSGDILSVYYRVDGTTGQTGKLINSTITANGMNQSFQTTNVDISGLSEGIHTLYTWVKDDKGGQSTEDAKTFSIGNTSPPIAPFIVVKGKPFSFKIIGQFGTASGIAGKEVTYNVDKVVRAVTNPGDEYTTITSDPSYNGGNGFQSTGIKKISVSGEIIYVDVIDAPVAGTVTIKY